VSKSNTRATRRLVAIGDAAEYAAVSTKTIRRRISDGSLTGYRMGPRVIRVDLNELDALLRPIPSANPSGTHATGLTAGGGHVA
jgi:excisionase family DNA binding protein